MGYFTGSELPFYYTLADAFTICDAYHCSVLGPDRPQPRDGAVGHHRPRRRGGGPVLVTQTRAGPQQYGKFTGPPCPSSCSTPA